MICWRDERGFTLAELLTAFAMLAFVLTAVVVIQHGAMQAYVAGSNKGEVQQNARVALERMAREIRETPTALTLATATSLTFVHQDTGIAVTYTLAGETLTRSTGGVDDVLIGRVRTLVFAYRDVDNNVLAAPVGTPADVRRVDITIETQSEDTVVADSAADARAGLTTTVRLRNL